MNRKRPNNSQQSGDRFSKKPKQINSSGQKAHESPPSTGTSTSRAPNAMPVIRINAEGKMEISSDPAVVASLSQVSGPPPVLRLPVDLKRKEDEKAPVQQKEPANPYLSTLGYHNIKRNQRLKPSLTFVEKGRFAAEAERARKLAELERLKSQIDRTMSKTVLASELLNEHSVVEYKVPEMEWWDVPFYADSQDIHQEHITNLIHHPAHLDPVDAVSSENVSNEVYLTTKERKRLRRLRRFEAQKEKQEQIRLGLLPPDEPKLKIANMMRVLGKEAMMDPTAMEKLVQKQVQERLERHLRANEERKLTPEQRSAKNQRKYSVDTTVKTSVCVFAVTDLSHPSHCFKVTKNAEQLQLTGICISYQDCNIVIVEGGPKSIRKYQHLMMNRIDWNQDKSETNSNRCVIVWEGLMNQAVFGKLRIQKCATTSDVQQLLTKEYQHLFELSKQALKPTTK